MDQRKPDSQQLKLTPAAAAEELAGRALQLAGRVRRRVIIGIAGGPGSGKSTLAAEIISKLNARVDGSAARVPMDGFHMKQSRLERERLTAFKGAPQTFEAAAFVDLLSRLKAARSPVSVPSYSRVIEDVVPDAFTISGSVPILVAEGNYLLLESAPWDRIRPLLDLSVYIEVPREIVRQRLLKRHAEHGFYTEERNRRHVEQVDLVNYDTVARSASRADLRIVIDTVS